MFREYLPRACCENYRYEELRAIILDSLEETLQHSQSRVNKPAKPPKVMTSGEEKAHLEALEEMIELEETPGERMVLMRYPSLATLSAEVYQERLAHRSPLAADLADRLRYLNQMRLHHLNLYGERGIHHRASIENYVEAGATDLSATQRRQQIERWIELLEDSRNQHYEVRLTEPELGFELNLKTVPPLMLGVRVNEQTPFTTEGGKSQWMNYTTKLPPSSFSWPLSAIGIACQWNTVPRPGLLSF
jgi:hypothetical protein